MVALLSQFEFSPDASMSKGREKWLADEVAFRVSSFGPEEIAWGQRSFISTCSLASPLQRGET